MLTSRIVQLLLALIVVASVYTIHKAIEQNFAKNTLFWSDAEGYYMYLPAAFIYDGFEDIPIKTTIQFSKVESTNKIYNKYPYGVAIMQSPFFLISHSYQKFYEPENSDGYGKVYQDWIRIGAIFYLIIGLFFLFRLLLIKFPVRSAMLGIAGILFGTNLFYYSFFEPGASHIYGFCLITSLLYLSHQIFEKKTWWYGVLYAILFSLALSVRYTNGFVIIYTLFQAKAFDSKEVFVDFFKKHYAKLLLMVLFSILVMFPQHLIWTDMKGEEVLFSYTNEGFNNWYMPKILSVLFSVQNGLFIYAPILILAIIGLLMKESMNVYRSKSIILILLVLSYVFGSWWAWWFGGAFGHRCYVEWMALFAIGLACFENRLFQNKNNARWVLLILISILFCYYTTSLSFIYTSPWDGPGWNWNSLLEKINLIF